MGGGGKTTTQETKVEIPAEFKPYASALGIQLSEAIKRYPLDFMFQYKPIPILPLSPEEMAIRNVVMGLPFGGQFPDTSSYMSSYSDIFLSPYNPINNIYQPVTILPSNANSTTTSSTIPSIIQDWLFTQQLAEIFGKMPPYSGGILTIAPTSKIMQGRFSDAFIRFLNNFLEQQGLPVNEYTIDIAKKAWDLNYNNMLSQMSG